MPVLLTEGIGDASGLVREQSLGAVLPSLEVERAENLRELDRFIAQHWEDRDGLAERCRAAAEKHWSWSEQVPRWLAFHDRLVGSR